MGGSCRYDFYQVKLSYCLSETERKIYNECGQNAFNVKLTNVKRDCSTCGINQVDCENVYTVTAKMPDAKLICVDVDNCSNTNALFNMVVRLPCVRLLSFSDAEKTLVGGLLLLLDPYNGESDMDALLDLMCCYNEVKTNIQTAYYDMASYISTLININSANYTDFMNGLITVLHKIEDLKCLVKSIDTYGNDPLKTAKNIVLCDINKLLVFFTSVQNQPNVGNTMGRFAGRKFTITVNMDGCEKDVVTFLVNPLVPDGCNKPVATGVFDKCYSYELTRVVPRSFQVDRKTDNVDYTKCTDGKYIPIDSCVCIKPCVDTCLTLKSNTLMLVIPMTHELKCFMGSAQFDCKGDELPNTIVKIVARYPDQFSFPAKMTFDVSRCVVIIEISQNVIINYGFNVNGSPEAPVYISEFGVLGCASSVSGNDYSGEKVLSLLDLNADIFSILSTSGRLDVSGVLTCTEKVFFTFQICAVPYLSFCVDACGCRVKTIPEWTNDDTPDNSYAVSACGTYTYGFSYEPDLQSYNSHSVSTKNKNIKTINTASSVNVQSTMNNNVPTFSSVSKYPSWRNYTKLLTKQNTTAPKWPSTTKQEVVPVVAPVVAPVVGPVVVPVVAPVVEPVVVPVVEPVVVPVVAQVVAPVVEPVVVPVVEQVVTPVVTPVVEPVVVHVVEPVVVPVVTPVVEPVVLPVV